MKFLQEFDPDRLKYCNVAAAVLGAGALGAGASIWGANKAVGAQTEAAQAAINNTNQIYGQNKSLMLPFVNGGASAEPALQAFTDPNSPLASAWQNWVNPNASGNPLSQLIKLTTPGADMSATLAQTPGYEFSKSQGIRGVLNSLAGRGLGGSVGAITKGVGDYVTGAAGNTWSSVVSALQNVVNSGSTNIGNAFNGISGGLQNLVNSGINAGSSVVGAGNQAIQSINSAITGAGNAQAAGANAMGSAVGGLGNSLSTAAILQSLLGKSGGGSVYGAAPTQGVGGLPAVY